MPILMLKDLLPRARGLVALALALAVVLAAVSPTVAAESPFTASGSWVQTSFVPSNFRTTGGVTSFDFTETVSLTGDFTGTSSVHGTCVVQASGQAECQAIETFTGTVAGRTGTVTFHDVASLDLATGTAQGTFTTISGTGGLANLQGHGSFQGAGGSGTLTAVVTFAP